MTAAEKITEAVTALLAEGQKPSRSAIQKYLVDHHGHGASARDIVAVAKPLTASSEIQALSRKLAKSEAKIKRLEGQLKKLKAGRKREKKPSTQG